MVANVSYVRSQARTEDLVDRLLGLVLRESVEDVRGTITRAVHRARDARKSGDPSLALETLVGLKLSAAPRDLACWAYAEWLAAARQLDLAPGALLYRAGTGQAAVLEPADDPSCLRVVAVLGLSWERGRVLSRRCLRGLTPLMPSPAVARGAE